MIARRMFLLAATAALLEVAIEGTAPALAPKKKLKKANDKDGVNNVIGAWWKVTATNTSTNAKRTFKFRAKDGVLYDRTGGEVGSLEPASKTESNMTWKEPLPLTGKFKITMSKVGHWGGVLETKDGQKWKCLLEAVDR
jgi:hypothetical protein